MLLDEIIDLATDNKQSITVLLRKCIVLSYQLKNERLKTWANKELNGYDPEDDLPPYRILRTIAKGNFSGSFGRQLRNWQIPAVVLEEPHRNMATETPLIHPVSTYEDLSTGDGYVESPWDPNMVLYYQRKIPMPGYALISAWQEIPTSGIIGTLDTIRTRVLNMALEIKSEIGKTDADLERITPQEKEKVDQTIVNNIFGGNAFLSAGNATMNATAIQQHQNNIVAGDWSHLEKVLKSAGMTEADLDELSTAVKSEGDRNLQEGGKVMRWIKSKAPKILAGGVKMGATVGQAVLTEWLMQYCGLKRP